MTRVFVVVAALCLAACASSSPHATRTPPSTTRTSSSSTSSSATTTRPVTTTTHLNAVVADQFTQVALMSAINAAHSLYLHSYDYTTVTPASLGPLVPNLRFGDISQASKKIVGVLAQDRNDVLLVGRSASGRWYCVTDNAMDGLSYGEGSTRDAVDSNGECQRDGWPPPGHDQAAF